jgi:hypothetical protein
MLNAGGAIGLLAPSFPMLSESIMGEQWSGREFLSVRRVSHLGNY